MKSEFELLGRPEADSSRSPRRESELGAIVANMWGNAETLLRAELDLGLAELDVRIGTLKRSLLRSTIYSATVYAGILLLLAALVLGLSEVMAPWFAALLVGSVTTVVGLTLSMRAEKPDAAKRDEEHMQTTARAIEEAIK